MDAERRRQARLRNYFNSAKWRDLFWPLREWPVWVQDCALQEHKGNRDRFTLFYFFAANGLDPWQARHAVLASDARPTAFGIEPQDGDYDLHARRQMLQMIKQVEDGSLFKSNKRYFDMHLQRPVQSSALGKDVLMELAEKF